MNTAQARFCIVYEKFYNLHHRTRYNSALRSQRLYCLELSFDTHSLTHSSRSLNDRWGIKDDRATTFLHSFPSSAFRKASPNPNSGHSDNYINYLPISFSACLSFSLLVPCSVGKSLQVLLIFLCAHTISICVFSQWG